MFVPVLHGCVWYVYCYVFAITERRDMGLYEVPFSMFLLGFGMGTMLANFHMIVWYYVVVMDSDECESKRAYVF